MKEKYILQYGDLAGWPYKIAKGFRNRGLNSISAKAVGRDSLDLDRKLPYDIAVFNWDESMFMRHFKKSVFFIKTLLGCELIHYHGGTILGAWHHLIEGRLTSAFDIPMLMSFGGGDARIVEMARKKNPYFYRLPDEARDKRIRKWLSSVSRYIRYAATDCEMKEYVEPYFEKVYTFRQPIDTEEIICRIPDKRVSAPRVLHIPTEPWAKGTEHIERAIEHLKDEGLSFEFKLTRQLTQKQVYEELADCDIYVDELRCGSYGVTAVEAMASGKPTVTYIREDLVKKYPPDLPLVSANPDTIHDVLKVLISNPENLHAIGKRSRAYAEKYHALDIVVGELLDIYMDIGYRG